MGNKDRMFIVARSLKAELQDYIVKEGLEQDSDSWLFRTITGT